MGPGCGTVPGAVQVTVTSVAGFAPQVSHSCSGAVVVGSGRVVVGGPDGGVGGQRCLTREGAVGHGGQARRGADDDHSADELSPGDAVTTGSRETHSSHVVHNFDARKDR